MSAGASILIACAAVCTAVANLSLRAGLIRAGGFSFSVTSWTDQILRLAAQPMFDLGLLLYAFASVFWFRILTIVGVSTAYPVLVSATFLLVTVGSCLLFQEQVSSLKVVGLIVILAGILIVSRS